MKAHHWIVLFLFAAATAFAVWDLYLFFSPHHISMSEWVIQKSERHWQHALGWFLFCCSFIVGGIILIWHWELPRIIKKWLSKKK